MMPSQRFIVLNNYKAKLKKMFNLNDNSGIYILTRYENGFKYAYIGQAKHIITRIAQHLMGREQHIDLSIKKHGLYDECNQVGWKIDYFNCGESDLDKNEQEYIRKYADMGYQLRNKTTGGQMSKMGLVENKERKGYRKGVKQGELKAHKYIKELFSKYLDFSIKPPLNKVKERKFDEFKQFIEENRDDTGT